MVQSTVQQKHKKNKCINVISPQDIQQNHSKFQSQLHRELDTIIKKHDVKTTDNLPHTNQTHVQMQSKGRMTLKRQLCKTMLYTKQLQNQQITNKIYIEVIDGPRNE